MRLVVCQSIKRLLFTIRKMIYQLTLFSAFSIEQGLIWLLEEQIRVVE